MLLVLQYFKPVLRHRRQENISATPLEARQRDEIKVTLPYYQSVRGKNQICRLLSRVWGMWGFQISAQRVYYFVWYYADGML